MDNYTGVVIKRQTDDELEHYGVLGMKWGVRRGRVDRAYAKASKKLAKIDSKIEKHQRKSAKALRKSDNFLDPFRNYHKNKATRQGRKATAQMRKADKWVKKMDEVFKSTASSLTPEQIAIGQKYTESLKLRTTRSMGY